MSKTFFSYKLFNVEINVYIGLIIITLIGFWPVSTGLFAVKNDDIVYFLPYRYNIVENIRNGHFPFWSPYIYMGFPIAGDMQSGAWNPFVWLFSLTGRYTLTTLHIELLVYLFLGGLGMFKLMMELEFNKIVCWTISPSFMFCGFMIDSGQILCWISCACFLPFIYLYFIRLVKTPKLSTSVKFAFANFLLIVGGYPFFFIANTYLLLIGYIVFFISAIRNKELKKAIKTVKYFSISVVLLLLLAAAPLLSFADLLPYYSRGLHLALSSALDNSYSLFSSISVLFPFSVTREHNKFYNTEEISRNIYVGIMILPFVLKGFAEKRTLWSNTVFILTLLVFLLSLGQQLPFRKWTYLYLPLMDTFRHPANFRLFVIIGTLLLAGKGINEFLLSQKETERKKLMQFYFGTLLFMLLIAFHFSSVPQDLSFGKIYFARQDLKKTIDNISFGQGVLVSMFMQIPFIITGILLVQKKKYFRLCYLSILNVIILCQPQIFHSIVGKDSTFTINQFIANNPQGFPLPDLKQKVILEDQNKQYFYNEKAVLGPFFLKQPAINTYLNNPTILGSYNKFINDSALISKMGNYPFIYFADSIVTQYELPAVKKIKKQMWLKTNTPIIDSLNKRNDISFISFAPNRFQLSVKTDTTCFVAILQNFNPSWKAYSGDTLIPIHSINHTFMGLLVTGGVHLITLHYSPSWFLPGIILSCLGLSLCMGFLLFKDKKNRV